LFGIEKVLSGYWTCSNATTAHEAGWTQRRVLKTFVRHRKSAVWLLDLLERKSLIAWAHYEEEFNKQWPRKQSEVVERGAREMWLHMHSIWLLCKLSYIDYNYIKRQLPKRSSQIFTKIMKL
jgi:hypothetical protein